MTQICVAISIPYFALGGFVSAQNDAMMLRIFTKTGVQYGIITRMPMGEIDKELWPPQPEEDRGVKHEWCTFHGWNSDGEQVLVEVERGTICGVVREKYIKKMIQPVEGRLVSQ